MLERQTKLSPKKPCATNSKKLEPINGSVKQLASWGVVALVARTPETEGTLGQLRFQPLQVITIVAIKIKMCKGQEKFFLQAYVQMGHDRAAGSRSLARSSRSRDVGL